MKNTIYPIILLALLSSCVGGPRGELIGVQNRGEWFEENPYGMNYIHFGSYQMGPNDQDVPWSHDAKPKTVTIPAFFIDQHEISNNEYRQFVYYVRDSLFLDALYQNDDDRFFIEEDEYGEALDDRINKGYLLNWDEYIDLEDADIREVINEFYLQGAQKFYDRREIDTKKLNYKFWWIDFKGAANKDGRDYELSDENQLDQLHSVKGHTDRSDFIIEENINIYPDTLVWVHDFTYGFNDPLTENYFWHQAYDDYPVVGVTWGQTKAFNAWRTFLLNEWRVRNGEVFVQRFRMPTEAEWEFAARGGLDLSPYPWGGPYIRNIQGCPLANFKPMRGDYVEDNGCYTVPIGSYEPNGYGLYNMAGNVAEWTSTAYDEGVYEFSHDMSPQYEYRAKKDDPPSLKRKVIRGGSWKDIGYFCQTGTRSYEYQDSAKSYVGMRSAMSYLGRGKTGDPSDWNENDD